MKTVLVFIFISFSLFAQRSLYLKKEFKSGSIKLPYRVLYPLNYNPDLSYPVVLFLHGVLEKGNNNESQLTNGADLFLKKEIRENFPAIVIFPQCPSTDYWASVDIDQSKLPIHISYRYNDPPTPALRSCIALINSFIENKQADKDRIYVMGLSMGGMGALEGISRYPDLFAAAVPMCGAGDTSYCEKYSGKVALWLFHGGSDVGMSPELSRTIVQKLERLGTPPLYTEYPGVGHNCWDKTFAEPELLTWLFKQKKRKRISIPVLTDK